MLPIMTKSHRIETPTGARLMAAAGMIFGDLPLADRARETAKAIRDCGQDEAVILNELEGDRISAAVYAQIQGGGQAFLSLPKFADDEARVRWPDLWDQMKQLLLEKGCTYAQCSVTDDGDPLLLTQVEFQSVARLRYLTAETSQSEEISTDPLFFDSYFEPADRDRLTSLLDSTYADSQDCPQVDGMRDTCDVLEGYRQTGDFDPENWFILQRDGKDVGCLLMADHSKTKHFELTYMGLIPEQRRQGLGALITQFAKRHCARRGRSRLLVAVDVLNTPAVACYAKEGFLELQENEIYALTLSSTE